MTKTDEEIKRHIKQLRYSVDACSTTQVGLILKREIRAKIESLEWVLGE